MELGSFLVNSLGFTVYKLPYKRRILGDLENVLFQNNIILLTKNVLYDAMKVDKTQYAQVKKGNNFFLLSNKI